MSKRKLAATEIYTEVVNYNDTSPKTLFTLPANTVIVDAFVQVVTAFDGSTPATIEIGDSSDSDGLIPSPSIDTTTTGFQALKENEKGAYLWDGSYKQMHVLTSDTDIIATFTLAGDETQGQVKVYVVVMDIRYL